MLLPAAVFRPVGSGRGRGAENSHRI